MIRNSPSIPEYTGKEWDIQPLDGLSLDDAVKQHLQPVKQPQYLIYHGDCIELIPDKISRNSVALIVTSPPYADQRKNEYGGIHPDQYVDWFLARSGVFYDVLKDSGSFVLNIKEKAIKGEKHPYVLHLILSLRQQGWKLVDEYVWHKKNCYPGKWPNRFRDSWERLLHFTKNTKFKMNQESVMVPMGDWAESRLQNLSETDEIRDESKSNSGFGKQVSNWIGREKAYPTNVLHLATECGYKGHPATFPVSIPKWFIKLFTDPGDLVLDPFAGSGTTLVAALDENRRSIGIDTERKYCDLMHERIQSHNE